jgi:hypothetical protein
LILRVHVLGLVLGFGRGADNPVKRSSGNRDDTPSRPITFHAAENLDPFELAQLWSDRTAWPLDERMRRRLAVQGPGWCDRPFAGLPLPYFHRPGPGPFCTSGAGAAEELIL